VKLPACWRKLKHPVLTFSALTGESILTVPLADLVVM